MNLLKIIFFTLTFLSTSVWSITIPFNEAPDEFTHVDIPVFIATYNRYPVFTRDENMGVSRYEIPGVAYYQNASYSAMPPLAYLWQSIFVKLFTFDSKHYLSARFGNNLLILIYVFFYMEDWGTSFPPKRTPTAFCWFTNLGSSDFIYFQLCEF